MYFYLPSANCGACEGLCYLDEECISHHSREVVGLSFGVTCLVQVLPVQLHKYAD